MLQAMWLQVALSWPTAGIYICILLFQKLQDLRIQAVVVDIEVVQVHIVRHLAIHMVVAEESSDVKGTGSLQTGIFNVL